MNTVLLDITKSKRKTECDTLLGLALTNVLTDQLTSDNSIFDYAGKISYTDIKKYLGRAPVFSEMDGIKFLKKITDLHLEIATDPSLYNLVSNIAEYTELLRVRISLTTSTDYVIVGNYGALTKCVYYYLNFIKADGDFSARTNIEYLFLSTVAGTVTLPKLGDNLNLNTIIIASGSFVTKYTSTSQIGALRNCTKLITFSYFTGGNGIITTAITDFMLDELLLAKQAGAPLTTVNIGGRPTNGSAGNASAIALRALGVTVTVNA